MEFLSSLMILFAVTGRYLAFAETTKYPEFVSNLPGSPAVKHADTKPTRYDIDLFIEKAFTVGKDEVQVNVVNQSIADDLAQRYIEDTHRRHQFDCFRPKDCSEVQLCGTKGSGVYRIYPYGVRDGVMVVCDLNTRCGGWTLIQRRQDGSHGFGRNWDSYMAGFGNLRTDFWMGLHLMNLLTSESRSELLVELSDYNGSYAWAKYDHFFVSDEQQNGRLFIRGYTGTAGDGFNQHNGLMFSTPDSDNDITEERHCAKSYNAGWWFGKCSNVNLNGVYASRVGADIDTFTNVIWFMWRKRQSLQWTEMKVRPVQFDNYCDKEKGNS